MWISGKPGAGKSTIMKFAYTNTKNKARRQHSVVASFFFNARGEYKEKSVFGMYRSLLLQLLEGYPVLQSVLDDPDVIPNDQSGCPSLNVLKDVFCDAVLGLGEKSFTCFVDALDECDEQQVVEMIQYFEDLAEQATSHNVPFRICFSSRHYPYISIKQGLRLTLEDQQGHSEDLEAYIASRLRVEDSVFREELQLQLLNKAAGVFMWLVLVVDILNEEDGRGGLYLRKRLAEIPSDLSELFKDILRRDNKRMDDLLLCILWILYAKRPLEPKEFYHALWSGLSLKALLDDQPPIFSDPDSSDSFKRFQKCIISSSKGLAEITKSKKPIVQFIHESVRDFLIKDKGLQKMWPELGWDPEGPSHEMLKQCCSLYMNHVSPRILTKDGGIPDPDAQRSYPFLEYACQYMFYHSDAAASLAPQKEFLDRCKIYGWILVNNFVEKVKAQRYMSSADDASLIYILADKGCPNLIRIRMRDYPDIHRSCPDERYKYPIFAALAAGNQKTVAALLNTPSYIYDGEDITKGLKYRQDMKGCEKLTPLTWAAQEGRSSIVRLLLLQGVDIDEADRQRMTALCRALANCHEETAMLLISSGANVNLSIAYMQAPLHYACEQGLDNAASLLLDKGAEIDVVDAFSRPPLSHACQGGHLRTLKLLIKRGAKINVSGAVASIPLLTALEAGHLEVAQFLINNGADINAKNHYGESPLSHASKKGYERLVRLLLDSGADVDVRDLAGSTPLFLTDTPEIAKLLIEHGADVNAKDKQGSTPLLTFALALHVKTSEPPSVKEGDEIIGNEHSISASSPTRNDSRIPAVLKVLLEHGADVNVRNKFGETPLLRSLQYGHEPLARLLIEHGADVNATTEEGETALMVAVKRKNEGLVRLLIDSGANVDAQDTFGNTALSIAAELKEGQGIVQILTDH